MQILDRIQMTELALPIQNGQKNAFPFLSSLLRRIKKTFLQGNPGSGKPSTTVTSVRE